MHSIVWASLVAYATRIHYLMNWVIFILILLIRKFLWGFYFRETVKIKPLQNGKITLSFTDIGNVANVSFNAIREN